MRTRFLAALMIAAAALPRPPPRSPVSGSSRPTNCRTSAPGDRIQNLDFLFGALKVAPDDVTAKAIEQRIWAMWTVSQSDTANLLMTRVKTAIEAKDLDLAISFSTRS